MINQLSTSSHPRIRISIVIAEIYIYIFSPCRCGGQREIARHNDVSWLYDPWILGEVLSSVSFLSFAEIHWRVYM